MINKRGMKLLLTLGLVVLALALFTPASWGGKPVDMDGDGFTDNKDCNDDPENHGFFVHPGAVELCDGIDNQCPGDAGYGIVDEGCGTTCTDNDGDGYYLEAGCGTPVDCDDYYPGIHPGAVEICDNGIDENCVGGDQARCTDSDGDEYFVPYGESDCGPVDCDDDNPDVHPGAIESCEDEIDNQCPGDLGYGLTNEVCSGCTNADGDDYFAEAGCGTAVDCDDTDFYIYPGAIEDCDTVYDDNCDGQVNEGCIVAGDSDGDGLSDAIEEAGFTLNSEYVLLDGSSSITGSSNCPPGEKCLDPSRRDLFVAWRPLEIDSRVDLATCNIFEFAANPISIGGADYTVWVTKEVDPPASSRKITNDSNQMLVLIIEDDSTSGSATGISQPGTIMVEGMGKGWIKTHKIELNIDTNCAGGTCKDADGFEHDPPYIELKCMHKKKTAIHEVWHVLSALNSPDMHIDDTDYIMHGSVLFTEKGPKKTYYIGDEFSPAGLNDPCFK